MTHIETLEEAAIRDAPPRQTAPLKIGRDARRRHGRGGFSIEIVHPGDLVLFSTDESAPVFKGGMFSGNALTPG